MVKANWWRPLPALALLAIAAVLSRTAGTPDDLPGVALGWWLLLHLERGAVLVAGLALVALIGTRATLGHFPFRLGQIEYAVAEMNEQFEQTKRFQQEQMDALKDVLANGLTDEQQICKD